MDLKKRLGLQLIFLVIVGGLMLASLGYFDRSWFGGGQERGRAVTREELAEEWRRQLRDGEGLHVELETPEDMELFQQVLEEELEVDASARRGASELAPFEADPAMLALAASRDRTAGDEELGVVVDESIVHQLHRALAAPEEVLEGEPVLSSARGDKVAEQLLRSPDLYRGQLVEIVGNLVTDEAGKSPLRLLGIPDHHPSGIERAYRSYVYDSDEKYHVVFSAEPQSGFAQLDPVVFRGYFCRLYTNDVEIDGEIRKGTIPLLVGVKHRAMPYEPASRPWVFYLVPIALILPAIGGVFIFLLSRRTERTYDTRREAARKAARHEES